MDREEQLRQRLVAVRQRIDAAADAAGRSPEDVTLIVVTKHWPAKDVRTLARLGVQHVGENRDQEARPKAEQCEDLPLQWHFVGQLQSNKAKSVAKYASMVHSIDRPSLVDALNKAVPDAAMPLRCLVQVSLDHDTRRGGVDVADVLRLADHIANSDRLLLSGVMTVAPLHLPAETAFDELRGVAAKVQADFPSATVVSAGMSGDLEHAIAAGATHVRVGSSVLGKRSYPNGDR